MCGPRAMSPRTATTPGGWSAAGRTAMPEAPAARRRDRSVVPCPGMTSLGGGSTGLDRGRDVDGDAEVREAPREHGVLRCALGPERDAELEELVPAGGDPYRRVEGVLAGR